MKLLVSPVDLDEAKAAHDGGADILDIKNPAEGSLGANFPWIISEIKKSLPQNTTLSATLGDLDNRPGFGSLASYGLSKLGVHYIKAGLFVGEKSEAMAMGQSIVKAAKKTGAKVVLAGYADYSKIGTLNPVLLAEIAKKTGADGIMIDTYTKNGNTLFDYMPMTEIMTFVRRGKKQKLLVALAGSIQFSHINKLKKLTPHIVGVRGAVCTDNDRNKGKIEKEKVEEFKKLLLT